MSQTKIPTNYGALTTLIIVFFFGFIAAGNDVLISVFKEKLKYAFYIAAEYLNLMKKHSYFKEQADELNLIFLYQDYTPYS